MGRANRSEWPIDGGRLCPFAIETGCVRRAGLPLRRVLNAMAKDFSTRAVQCFIQLADARSSETVHIDRAPARRLLRDDAAALRGLLGGFAGAPNE